MPKGWVIADWADIVGITHGQNQRDIEDPDGIFPIYGSGGQIGKSFRYLCKAGSTVIGRKGTINRPFFTHTDFWNIDTAFGITPCEGVLPRYLFLFCRHFNFKSLDRSTTIPSLTQKNLYSINMPLPPHAEQQRIVAIIDALFSKLDKGVETLKTIRRQLRTYRQAVLKWAFEDKKWNMAPLRSITTLVTSGSRGWAKYYSDKGAKFIRIGNLTRDTIKLKYDDIQHVVLPNNAEGLRSLLFERDMLISITADLGSIGIVPVDLGEAYINQHIALARFVNPNLVLFYAYYLKSEQGRKALLRNRRGATKIGLGLDDIRNTPVPFISEQCADEIVAAIESRLSVCDKLEAIVDENLVKAEALRQSILKKAFAGKLVPQDPDDEPAEKLLARIKSEQKHTVKKTGTGRIKKNG